MSDDTAKKRTKSDEDILRVARKRLDTAMSAWSETREDENEDLKFAAGSPDNNWQWPEYARITRNLASDVSARPMLTINKLPQHIKQITNDQLQNLPSVDVIPVSDGSVEDVADIYEGIVRHIEVSSDADIAYGQAGENQVTYGEGYIRILTDYTDEDSFDQDIIIDNIPDSFCIYLDPLVKRPCAEDMKWALITEDLTHEDYEELYPDAQSISSIQQMGTGDQGPAAWISEKTIRIAEYFCFESSREKLCQFSNGQTAFEDEPKYEQLVAMCGKPVQHRMSERKKVKWYKINGYEILEERDWPGKYIPIVRVVGNEFRVDGRVYLSGIVRNAKDAQRMYNYHASQEVEMIALAPKAPFIGASGQFDGFEKDWKTANTKNHPYLQYNPVVDDATGQPLPPPQRVQPPMVQAGIIQAKQGASEDIKEATGQYNAALGQVSNERSAKAIVARDHQSDVSTFHYGNNLARAVRMVGRICVDLIPKIYDTQRIARIIGEDGKSKMVKLDPTQPQAVTPQQNLDGTIQQIYNPNVGKYGVAVVTGPGFSTKRKEALQNMSDILQANPESFDKIGDLVVEEMDWPGHQKISKRLAKFLPPQVLNDDGNPVIQQLHQQNQQLNQELQQAHQMLQNAQNSFEAREVAVKEAKVRIDMYDAETRRIAATVNPAPMTEQQVQDIATGVVHAAIQTGDTGGMPVQQPQQEQQPSPPLDPNKVLAEASKHALQSQQHAHEAGMQQQQLAAQMQAQQQPTQEGS